MNRNPLLGTPKEADGATYEWAEETSGEKAAELVQTSLFTVRTRCSLPDACKGANEEPEYQTAYDVSV